MKNYVNLSALKWSAEDFDSNADRIELSKDALSKIKKMTDEDKLQFVTDAIEDNEDELMELINDFILQKICEDIDGFVREEFEK